MTEYALIKLIHLGALVFWLGPALGAWFVLKAVEDGSYKPNSVVEKVSDLFFVSIILEHLAFLVLLITGFIMANKYDLFDSLWLQQKLMVVFFIIVPLEILDVLLGNWIASHASKKYTNNKIKKPGKALACVYIMGFLLRLH